MSAEREGLRERIASELFVDFGDRSGSGGPRRSECVEMADRILALLESAEPAPGVEPVAWRFRWQQVRGRWTDWVLTHELPAARAFDGKTYEAIPLYAHPPTDTGAREHPPERVEQRAVNVLCEIVADPDGLYTPDAPRTQIQDVLDWLHGRGFGRATNVHEWSDPPERVSEEGALRHPDLWTVLEDECWDVRSRNVPTGGDDYDVEWFVVEHYMADPTEREIGSGKTPIEAVRRALEGTKGEG
jgi:hypothetical protein